VVRRISARVLGALQPIIRVFERQEVYFALRGLISLFVMRVLVVSEPQIENGNLFQALGSQIVRWTRRLSHLHSSNSSSSAQR
jgi:hypothetical protein